MKNRIQRFRYGKLKYMLLAVMVATIGFFAWSGWHVNAADTIYIEIDGQTINPDVAVDMKSSKLQLNMKSTGTVYEDESLYRVQWAINDFPEIADVGASATTPTIGIVQAKGPGICTVTVTVFDRVSGGQVASTTCKINVIFSIDTTENDAIFKKVNSTDEDRSLVMYADSTDTNGDAVDNPLQLSLNFGESTDAQWTSLNQEVVEIERTTGKMKPIGAGHTVIMATYTPDGTTDAYSAELNIYIIPRVADKETDFNNKNFSKSLTVGHAKGDYLYLDTIFGDNNTEPIGSKVSWVIMKDQGANRVPIANSLTGTNALTSNLISLDPPNSQSSMLEINAKAGIYYIYFYAADTYFGESNKTTAYSPTMVKLTVYADFDNYKQTLQMGDAYSIADAFNLTVDDFNNLFASPVMSIGDTGDASNYATYASTTTKVTTTNITNDLRVKLSSRSSAVVSTIKNLTNPSSSLYGNTSFTIYLNVIDKFQLDRTSVIISVGQTLQLNAIYNGTLNGTIEWSTSGSNYVTVDSTGKVTGLKVTDTDIIVTASYTDTETHVVKNATCSVKVEAAVQGFTISDKILNMEIGDNATVKVTLKQTVSIAPLKWFVLDETVATVETAADNKSAVITAKKGGTTQLVVENTTTGSTERQTCTINVLEPMETLKFDETSITAKTYLGEKKVTVSYTPKDSNASGLVWTSSDDSVASIDGSDGENGVGKATVTMKKAGTVILTASPEYNPFKIYAICTFKVLSSAESITLNPTEMTLNAGYGNIEAQQKQITLTLDPVDCTTTCTWSSSENNIATVDSNGIVTAKKAGTAVITVQTEENLLRTCKVTVMQPCAEISFSPATYTMQSGTTYTPKLVCKPADTTDTFTWKSYNTKVATVNSSGVITGVKTGTTFIEVKTSTGPLALLQITVQDALKSIEFPETEKTIYKGTSFAIIPTFTPVEAYNKSLKWTSSNSAIASVTTDASGSNATVTGLKGGTVIIRAVAEDGGYSASCLVTVMEKSTSVSVSPKKKYLKKGSTFTIKASVKNDSATNKKVTWSTGNKKIATVTSAGKVKGKKIGTVYIKAKAKDGSGASASCKVIVVRKVTSVKLNKYSAKVLVGKTIKLKKYIKPKNATIKTVTWTSSNNAIATVDSSGRVQGIAEGMAKIRAKANDGSGKAAVCLVTVMEPVEATGVTVGKATLTVAKGTRVQSGIVISPANSTDKIKYFSDNKYVASVDKYGRIKAKHAGQAVIYGKTSNGKIGYSEVLVVSINRSKLTLRQYDTETLWVNQISTGVMWYSSNPLIASVSGGKVVGRTTGSTTIYAVVNGLRLPCRVLIKKI